MPRPANAEVSRRRRLPATLLSLAVSACAAPSASYEYSLRAWLRAPNERDGRAADLRAMLAEADVRAGVRLSAVHQTLRAGQSIDADAWLDAEAAAFPGAARFLAAYRMLMQLPERSAAAPARGVIFVIVIDRTKQRDVVADMLATIEQPLRAHGHYVVPVEVGGDLVGLLGGELARVQRGLVDAACLRRLHEIGVSACLVVDILDFFVHEALAVELARHEVWYRLLDTATGAVLWERPAIGRYERREPNVIFGDEDDTFFYPSSLGAVFHDQIDFVRALNRGILRTVP